MSNGVERQEDGYFKKVGDQRVLVVIGVYSYYGNDGKLYRVFYKSDENGYRTETKESPFK